MSEMLDAADAIKARLLAWKPRGAAAEDPPPLAGVSIIVDRQKDVTAKVGAAIGKTQGNAITILWDGFGIPDPEAGGVRIASRYTIRTWSMPVVEEACKEPGEVLLADTIVKYITLALHQWNPVEGGHNFGEMKVTGADLTPHVRWLVYTIGADIKLSL